jgi:hypothetical protein
VGTNLGCEIVQQGSLTPERCLLAAEMRFSVHQTGVALDRLFQLSLFFLDAFLGQ